MDGVLDGKVLGKVVTGKGDVKKGIEAKRKEESARGVNWATLYMNVRPVPSNRNDTLLISAERRSGSLSRSTYGNLEIRALEWG